MPGKKVVKMSSPPQTQSEVTKFAMAIEASIGELHEIVGSLGGDVSTVQKHLKEFQVAFESYKRSNDEKTRKLEDSLEEFKELMHERMRQTDERMEARANENMETRAAVTSAIASQIDLKEWFSEKMDAYFDKIEKRLDRYRTRMDSKLDDIEDDLCDVTSTGRAALTPEQAEAILKKKDDAKPETKEKTPLSRPQVAFWMFVGVAVALSGKEAVGVVMDVVNAFM